MPYFYPGIKQNMFISFGNHIIRVSEIYKGKIYIKKIKELIQLHSSCFIRKYSAWRENVYILHDFNSVLMLNTF